MEGCWQSGGPDYLLSLALAFGLGGMLLVLRQQRFNQSGSHHRPVGGVLGWMPRVLGLAIAAWGLVGLGLREGLGEALQTLLIFGGVFGVVGVVLWVGARPAVAAGQPVRWWPLTRTNVPVWLGAVLLVAAVGMLGLQYALGHPCA